MLARKPESKRILEKVEAWLKNVHVETRKIDQTLKRESID